MTKPARRTADPKTRISALRGRSNIVIRTSDGAVASDLETVRTKAQADEAISKLLGRSHRTA